MKLSENLLKYRKEKALSQEAVASALGMATRVYQRYEHGEREPQASVLITMADFFEVSLDELVGRERADT